MLRVTGEKSLPGLSRLVYRFYVTEKTPKKLSINTSNEGRYDKSLLKSALWVLVFGSVLTNVLDRKKQYEELERRYSLKISILNDLIVKVRNGERNIDFKEELRLVNKLFSTDKSLNDTPLIASERVSKLVRKKPTAEREIRDNEEETLEDIWNGILKDLEDDKVKNKIEPRNTFPEHSADGDIITESDLLRQKTNEEDELRKYVSNTSHHVIVENAGDLVNAPNDSSISKFL